MAFQIQRATEKDQEAIVSIGKVSVADAHRGSCPDEVLNEYIEKHYNAEEITRELSDPKNIYHIIYYDGKPAGFSKIILNAEHTNVATRNATMLDRIYLSKEFQGHKLGFELLKFNIDLAKNNDQSGIWLFTWIGNKKAIEFYTRMGFTIIGSHRFQVTETHSNPNHQMYLAFS